MAESVIVSYAVQYIDEDSKALELSVGSEAGALRDDLWKLEDFLVKYERNRQGGTNDERVNGWFSDLRKIAYDTEDLVDGLVSNTDCTAFSTLRHLRRARRDSKKLRDLRKQVRDIMSSLSLDSQIQKVPSQKNLSAGGALSFQHTHQRLDADFVVGIDEDVKMLVEMLVGKSQNDIHSNQSLMHVLAIVGMGGSGKTTLAGTLYNHAEIRKHFNQCAWISLPQVWTDDYKLPLWSELLHQMIRGSSRNTNDHRDVNSPISDHDQGLDGDDPLSRLQNLLKTKFCLVVLDDVWDWNSIQNILKDLFQSYGDKSSSYSSANCNSKIIITSRRIRSTDTQLNWVFHETKFLNDENSWMLFNKMSRSNSGKELATEYKGLAMTMLNKCKGLPLAIVALGRLLKRKDTIQEWERVLNQLNGEEGPHMYGPVKDILALSYDDLPRYLKPCFLYLGLMAEESTISAGTLKRMWIAEGFVKDRQQNDETPEVAAGRLLQELVDHTMVQVVSKTYTEKVNKLRLHDMMRDICITIAQRKEILTQSSADSDQTQSRRAAINLSKCSLPLNSSRLRSLLLLEESSKGAGVGKQYGSRVKEQGTTSVLAPVFEKFKLLRVLDIKGIITPDGTMPKEIGNLIHLRYLGIRSTNIQELPRSIGKLRKLITFDYWNVSVDNEIRLPNVFWKLERLRHLFLPNEMMTNIQEGFVLKPLVELQTLWGVKGGDWMLTEMQNLNSRLTKLYIQGISNPDHLKQVFKCPAIEKDRLNALALDWYGFPLESESLDMLSSKKNLRRLRLSGRAPDTSNPIKFPSGLGKLELYYTHLEDSRTLDAIGELYGLKFLGLAKDSFIGKEWIISKPNLFPCLEELKLSGLPNLEEWEIREDTIPCLKKLSLISCTSLKKIPEGLKSITTLKTLEIRHMPTTFNNRLWSRKESNATTIVGEDFHIVQHIPNIDVKDSCTPLL